MRIIILASLLAGCVDLSTVCPYGSKIITQGVFGEITDATGEVEQGVEVDIFTILNGQKDMMFASPMTGRGGYQINALAGTYMLCAKTVCTTITVPTGLVEQSASDAATPLVWSAPVAVPPAETIGACTWGD